VPSEANTVLLAEALRVPAGLLLEQRGCSSSGTAQTPSDSPGGRPVFTGVRGTYTSYPSFTEGLRLFNTELRERVYSVDGL
jgi:hypothetical protein